MCKGKSICIIGHGGEGNTLATAISERLILKDSLTPILIDSLPQQEPLKLHRLDTPPINLFISDKDIRNELKHIQSCIKARKKRKKKKKGKK